ncbi:hypothetical protein JT358_12450, partial [Micrococcales bacterium 31B]|nr:hypothetical protein [Micrococcales bacterium 31B]
ATNFTVTVAAPVISVPAEGAALEPGDATTITGTALPGAVVSVTVNGGEAQTTEADNVGAWSLSGVAVVVGANTVSATQTINGTTSAASVTSNFTVKIAAPEIISPTAGQALIPGTTATTITGKAAPGATVNITLNEAEAVTANADETGAWSLADAAVTVGDNTLSVTQTLNGQTSVQATVAFSVAAAVQATITAPAADATVIDTDGKITVTGTNAEGQKVSVTGPEGDVVDATVTGTTWTAEVNATADKADAVVTAQATYTANNYVVPEPASIAFKVLTAVPVPTITGPTLLDAGTTTSDITGMGFPGATVNVRLNGGAEQTATVNADSTWTLADAAVQPGANEVTATQTVNGATSASSAATNFTVTVAAPVISVPAEGAALEPGDATTITGTALPGAVVSVTVNGGEAQTTEAEPRPSTAPPPPRR